MTNKIIWCYITIKFHHILFQYKLSCLQLWLRPIEYGIWLLNCNLRRHCVCCNICCGESNFISWRCSIRYMDTLRPIIRICRYFKHHFIRLFVLLILSFLCDIFVVCLLPVYHFAIVLSVFYGHVYRCQYEIFWGSAAEWSKYFIY